MTQKDWAGEVRDGYDLLGELNGGQVPTTITGRSLVGFLFLSRRLGCVCSNCSRGGFVFGGVERWYYGGVYDVMI